MVARSPGSATISPRLTALAQPRLLSGRFNGIVAGVAGPVGAARQDDLLPGDQDLDLAIAGEACDVTQWCCRHRLAHGHHRHRHALDAGLAQNASHRRGTAPGEVQIVAIPSALIGVTDDPGRLAPAPWQGRQERVEAASLGVRQDGPVGREVDRMCILYGGQTRLRQRLARRRLEWRAGGQRREEPSRGAAPAGGRAEVTGHRWLLNPT